MSEKIDERTATAVAAPPRWIERPRPEPGREGPEDRAAALLRQLREPPLLGASALARIADRLDAAPAPSVPSLLSRRWRPLWLAPVLGGATALVALALRGPAPVAVTDPPAAVARAAAPRHIALEGGASERLAAGGASLALLGPASATVDGAAPVALRAGRLVVRAGAVAVSVAVPGGRVAVAPAALVEIDVRARGGLRVAAYAGTAAVEQGGVLVEVSTGQLFEGGALAPASAAERAAAERAIDGAEPSAAGEPARSAAPGPTDPSSIAPGGEPASAEHPAQASGERTAAPAADRPMTAHGARPALAGQGPSADPSLAGQGALGGPAQAGQGPSADPTLAGQGASADRPGPGGLDSPAGAPSGESGLAAESRLLGDALGRLRARDGAGALALLDEHRARFPRGALTEEAQGERVDALLLLGRRPAALAELDALPLEGRGRGAELRVLRAELRAESGRCPAALSDFTAALADGRDHGLAPALEERARYGRATCRARAGDPAGARAELTEYLLRFPGGRFSDAAREALGR